MKNIWSAVRGRARGDVVAMAVLCAVFATATAQDAEFGLNLLKNGDGSTLDGWTNTYSTYNKKFEIWRNDYGSWFASCAYDCQLSQTVTLADYGLSANVLQLTASGIVWAGNGSKVCNVKVYELDASGNVLATHVVMDRPGQDVIIKDPGEAYSATFSLLPGTSKLKYELNGRDAYEWNGTWGPRFRDCRLTVDGGAIGDKQILTIDNDVTLQGKGGISPINVVDGARAIINIKKGATLTVRGQDADGRNSGTSAIFLYPSSTLYIVGEGTLVATGGAAANGGNGSNGGDAVLDLDGDNHFMNGAGGNGGFGGAGAGAGIRHRRQRRRRSCRRKWRCQVGLALFVPLL